MDPQLTSLIVPSEEIAKIEECLNHLVEDTGGNYTLLLDKSGQVIASQGDGDRQDITALGGADRRYLCVFTRGGEALTREGFPCAVPARCAREYLHRAH